MDPYHLRSHTQSRVPRTDRQTDTIGTDQTAAKTLSETDRRADHQTDPQSVHQTDELTPPAAPLAHVVPTMSGFTSTSSHAPGISPGTSSQRLSADTTVDMMVHMTPPEDPELAKTDYYLRGPGEERPVFPSLTLSAAGAFPDGASQGMDTWRPPLVPDPAAVSRPQALAPLPSVAHTTSHTSNPGAGQSTHFWDDVEFYTEQERSSVRATATTFTHTPPTGTTI